MSIDVKALHGKAPPISISLSNPYEVEDKNGSWANGDKGSTLFPLVCPLIFVVSLLSSLRPKADKESNGGKDSNVAKIGVDGGTKGLVELFNDDDREAGSSLITLGIVTAMAAEPFRDELSIGIPFMRHFFSNS